MDFDKQSAFKNWKGKLVVMGEMRDEVLLKTYYWFLGHGHIIKRMREISTDKEWSSYADRIEEVRDLLKKEIRRRKLKNITKTK